MGRHAKFFFLFLFFSSLSDMFSCSPLFILPYLCTYSSVTESDARAGKRARLLVDECEEDGEMEESQAIEDQSTFDDLCADKSFPQEEGGGSGAESGNWGLLHCHMLARVFHFLRSDMKSLTIASLTCKHWRAAVTFYKDISRQVDFSSVGPDCTDPVICNIMVSFTYVGMKDIINICTYAKV